MKILIGKLSIFICIQFLEDLKCNITITKFRHHSIKDLVKIFDIQRGLLLATAICSLFLPYLVYTSLVLFTMSLSALITLYLIDIELHDFIELLGFHSKVCSFIFLLRATPHIFPNHLHVLLAWLHPCQVYESTFELEFSEVLLAICIIFIKCLLNCVVCIHCVI